MIVKWLIITFFSGWGRAMGQEVEEDVGRVEEGSPALTSVSVTLSWTRPDEAWHSLPMTITQQRFGYCASASYTGLSSCVWTDESDTEVMCYFIHANPNTRLWNNYSSGTPTYHSQSLGSPTHNHPPQSSSSHRPPTCPQPAKLRKETHFFPMPTSLLSHPLTPNYFRPHS